jgi:tetratricopeptide (TPR) repeat protein
MLAMAGIFNNEEDNSDLFGRSEEEQRRHRAEKQPRFTKNRAVTPAVEAAPSKKKLLLFMSPVIVGLLFLCLPVNASSFLTGLAQMLRNGKHFDNAIQVCNLALQINPASASTYMLRASIDDDCQHYDQAIADYNRAALADPQLVSAVVGRGMARYKSHDYKSAIADFEQALKMQPDNADVYVRRGIAHARLGEYDAAIADYSQATKIDPTNSEAMYNKSWVMDLQYDQTMENENSGAQVGVQKSTLSAQVADLSKKLEQSKTDPQLYYTRGLACLKLRKTKEAISDFNDAIRLNPKMATVYVNRGLAYSSERLYDKAIADYTAAVAINSQNASAYYRRGLAYDHTANYSAALADYQMAQRLNPSGAKLYANLAAADQRRLNPSVAQRAATATGQTAEKGITTSQRALSSTNSKAKAVTESVQPNIDGTVSSDASKREHFKEATNLSNNFKHAEAVAAWTVVLKEQPQNRQALFLYHREKGIEYNLQGKFAESVKELNAGAQEIFSDVVF